MKKKAFYFSLKTWLTALVVSPILFTIWSYDTAGRISFSEALSFIGYSIPYGAVLSLAGFLVMLLFVFYLQSREWTVIVKKALLIAGTLLVTMLTFYFMFGWGRVFSQTSIWKIEVVYAAITIAGIVFYRLE